MKAAYLSCAHHQLMLDADSDGLITSDDLCKAAQWLCTMGGPVLVPKERFDFGDALVVLTTRMGLDPCWRSKVRAGPDKPMDGCCQGLQHLRNQTTTMTPPPTSMAADIQ